MTLPLFVSNRPILREVVSAIEHSPQFCEGIPISFVYAVAERVLVELADLTPYPQIVGLTHEDWGDCSHCEYFVQNEDLHRAPDGDLVCKACMEEYEQAQAQTVLDAEHPSHEPDDGPDQIRDGAGPSQRAQTCPDCGEDGHAGYTLCPHRY